MTRPVTIEDVALAAGVSVATVSRALRNLPNVAPSTREKVQAVADELQYRPDPSASALAAGRTRTVAMAVPVLDSWYFTQVMAGAEAVLSGAGYDLLLFSVDTDERRQRLLAGPLLKRADGLIVVDLRIPDGEAAALLASSVEVVAVGIEIPGASAVVVDDHRIAFEAVTHLASLGHRRIALIEGLPDDPLRFHVPAERRRGYADALAAAGHHEDNELVVAGNFSVEGGREAMARLLDASEPPTAVFAMSDEMAFGALRELWDRGLDAPCDVSVIGVDDHDFASIVGLTTVQQEVARHGEVAARMLLDRLDTGVRDIVRHTPTATFIERSTAGPCS